MKILLTGASGNIGGSALAALDECGHDVRAPVTPTASQRSVRAYRHN